MREYKEVEIELGLKKSAKQIIEDIEKIASSMYVSGWFYESCYINRDLSKIILFFYRELEVEAKENEIQNNQG